MRNELTPVGATLAIAQPIGHPRGDAATTTLRVSEIFRSIQGEGVWIGVPTTFVRLSGCPLKCRWCDTKYASYQIDAYERMTIEAIASQVATRHVVLTGGEPLIQDLQPLLDLLKEKTITVETSGARWAEYSEVSLWSVSPKLGSSGETPNREILSRFLDRFGDRLQFKFVIADERDLCETKELLASLPEVREKEIPIILQPEGGAGQIGIDEYLRILTNLIEREVMERPADWVGYNLRILPQLHRLCWGEQRGI